MIPQLVIPMGPTGPTPVQTIAVTPVGTGYVAPASGINALGVSLVALFLFYLYKRRHHHGGLL